MCQPGFHVFCYGSPDSTIKPDPSLRCDCGVYRWGQAPDLSRESSRGQIDRLTRANATLQQQLMDEKTLSSDQHENLLATRGKVERLTAEVERQCQANRTLKSELTAARNQLFKDNIELMLDGKTTPQQVLKYLLSRGIVVNRFEIATPPLNEIFLKVVGKDNE